MANRDAYDEQQGLEVALAQMETRLRTMITELMEPTIQRTSLAVSDLETVKNIVSQHARSIQDVQLGQCKSIEHVGTIISFKEELARWDTQRRAHESQLDEKQEAMQQKLDAFQYGLEQKESALHHLHRSVDRVATELNHVNEEQEIQKEAIEARLDEQSHKVNQFKSELEVRLVGLELKHNSLTDELWGEETGLAKVAGELKKTNAAFAKLQEAVATLEAEKAEAKSLDKLRAEVGKMVHDANTSVATMRQSVGNVVNDVREHFRTASQTISAHNATFISEVREQYQEELANAARLRDEVQGFVARTGETIAGLDARVAEAAAKASSLAAEAREEVEELNRRRKRDKTSSDNELKALKKRLGGVFDNSDMVLRGIEHIYGVLQTMLEGELIQCSMERQDSIDRKRIALMGVKDDETVLSRTCQSEPQRPRPEVRTKTTCGVKTQGVLRGGLNDRLAKPQEPVVRVDNRCLSCSGQAPLVLSAFKMACLQYTPSAVDHSGVQHDRDDLLEQRHRMLQTAHGSLLEGPSGIGPSGGPKGAPPVSFGSDNEGQQRRGSLGKDETYGDAFSEYAAVEARLQPSLRGNDQANATLRLPNLSAAAAGMAVSLPTPRALTAR